jgi:hypothetical protein
MVRDPKTSGLANGSVMLFTLLARSLDEAGVLDRQALAAGLRSVVAGSERDASRNLDLIMLANAAAMLDDPPPPGWTPRVLPGGRSTR